MHPQRVSNMAVHHAPQVIRQSATYRSPFSYLRRGSFILAPAPAEEGQTVEHEVTSLGLEVTRSYTIKESLIGGGLYQFEVADSEGNPLFTPAAGDRDDALLEIAVWLTEGEDRGDLPDYT